ncbi:MAG: YitT family protein [Erysipelotrichaceae bacterium]
MKNKITERRWFMLLAVIVGALISAINIRSFIHAGGLFPGGFTGVTVLIQRIAQTYFQVEVPYSLINILLNVGPAFLAYKTVGKRFTMYSCLMIGLSSFFVDILPVIPLTDDILLVSIFGGIVGGLAVGIVLKANASSGGTDFIAMHYAKKFNVSTWNYVLGFNAIIILIAGALFGWEKALYSIIFQFVSTQVVKYLHVRYERVTLFIVSSNPDLLVDELLKFTHHGVTRLEGIGGYSKLPRTMLYTVISSNEVSDVMKFVRKIDASAFINVTKSVQIDGNFYQPPIE